MITVKLHPSVFLAGNHFYGVPPEKAVLHVGGDRNDLFLAKNPGVYGPESTGFRGNQYQLMIDRVGTQFENLAFEMLMQNAISANSYGKQIVYLIMANYIQVYQDTTLLTATQVAGYTAP